jgi:hypothetical protein
MSEAEILENNKAIAEFMDRYKGYQITECEDEIVVSRKESKWGDDEIVTRPFTYTDLEYHTSWDWLMPVVEKIEGIPLNEDRYSVVIRDNECVIYCVKKIRPFLASRGKGATKLSATYQAVCEFIKQRNHDTNP